MSDGPGDLAKVNSCSSVPWGPKPSQSKAAHLKSFDPMSCSIGLRLTDGASMVGRQIGEALGAWEIIGLG